MTEEILNLIDNCKYEDAHSLVKNHYEYDYELEEIYHIWAQVYDGFRFENIDRSINLDCFGKEVIEAVKLYIHLSQSNWDKDALAEFRRMVKLVIAEASSDLRTVINHTGHEQFMQHPVFLMHAEIRDHLQQLIEHFDEKELYESKADIARVKAQLTLTMNLDKRFAGADMIQYGRLYEKVKQYEDSIQIYHAVIRDFEEALEESYENKEEQLLELGYLKEAYEGALRLTHDTGIPPKLNRLSLLISTLQTNAR